MNFRGMNTLSVVELVKFSSGKREKVKRFIGIFSFGFLRFMFYGMIGVFSEVAYYSIVI
jgi:hypothetical protein